MTIADKILRAKADYDDVFEAGKRSVESSVKFTEVESTSYRTTAPNNVLPFAKVNKIGGMTHKTRNLIPFGSKSLTLNGVTFTPKEDGSIIVNGTATDYTAYELVKQGGAKSFTLSEGTTYTLSGCPQGGSSTTFDLHIQDLTYHQTIADYGSGASFSSKFTGYYVFIVLRAGCVANNLVFRPMLNEGTTALPYEPYFDGIRNAKVTELKSEFGNLFNYDNIIDKFKGTGENEGKIVIKDAAYSMNIYTGEGGSSAKVPREYWNKLMFLTKGTYYAYFDIDFYENDVPEANRYINARAVLLDGQDYWCGQGGQQLFSGGSFTMYEDGYCYLRGGTNKRCYISNLMITRTPKSAYIPYKYESIPIPEAIKSLDGYGLGKNADEYNYIDFDNKIFKQEYEKVRLPADSGSYVQSMNWYAMNLSSLGLSPITRNVVCNILHSNDVQADLGIDGIYINSSMSHIVIRKSEFTTQAEYRQWLSDNEVYIIERIAEPIETDISAYLTDEYIEVEGGGTVTVVNEYQLDAPTTISYISEI